MDAVGGDAGTTVESVIEDFLRECALVWRWHAGAWLLLWGGARGTIADFKFGVSDAEGAGI